MGLVDSLSDTTGIRGDAIRLFLTMLSGYPLAILHRTFFYNKSPSTQHIFFVIAGISLYIFNYGHQVWHSLLSTLAAYVITNFLPGTPLSVLLAHVTFLGHLLVGYWFAESAEYDMTWTTPFCIMTLRYISLVMDIYDGQKPRDKVKPDQLKTAIPNPPGLLEIAAYGYFFAGTFVGPQFSLARFRSFVNGEFLENGEVRQSSIMVSIRRFVAGVTYCVLNQWGAVWIPDSFFNSQEFFKLPFLWKMIWNTIWFRATMSRYACAWCLTEGAAILAGLGYNGKDEKGEDQWDGVRDLNILKWELGSDYQSVVESFNCGTNAFAKNHIFKRLRWLGNKYLSHLLTLIYLAVWHGYHLGYFILFFYEFTCVVAQEQLYSLIKRTPGAPEFFAQPFVRPFTWLFGRIMINISMAFGFFTFGLIKKEIWWAPVTSMYFYGYIFYFLVWPATFQILLRVLPRKPKSDHAIKEEKTGKKSEEKKEL
jgi:lysophospholipid acyltransferase 5